MMAVENKEHGGASAHTNAGFLPPPCDLRGPLFHMVDVLRSALTPALDLTPKKMQWFAGPAQGQRRNENPLLAVSCKTD